MFVTMLFIDYFITVFDGEKLNKIIFWLSISCRCFFFFFFFAGLSYLDLRVHVLNPRTKHFITKTCLFKYIEHITTKNWKFSDKISDSFHISA